LSTAWIDGGCRVAAACHGPLCDPFDVQRQSLRDLTQLQCKFTEQCPAMAEAGRCGPYRYLHKTGRSRL
jgi:hypothetical protein